MTIREAISRADLLKPNRAPREEKLRWLSQCDGAVFRDVISQHQGSAADFEGYGGDADLDRELLAPPPYDEMYRFYLEMQIDLVNGDMARYNNSAQLYNAAFQAFAAWYNRSRLPRAEAESIKL